MLDISKNKVYNINRKIRKVVEELKRKGIIKERPTKYILKYGKSLKEIAAIFGVSLATVHVWLKNPKKREWLENKLKKGN